jgi:hypothetical protein
MEEDNLQKILVKSNTEEEPPPAYIPAKFTLKGPNIIFDDCANSNPQYSLSSDVFDTSHSGGLIILYDGGDDPEWIWRRLYDISSTRDSKRTILIEGLSQDETFKELLFYQDHTYKHSDDYISLHIPWKIIEKGQTTPIIEIHPDHNVGVLHMLRQHFDSSQRKFLWHDNTGNTIAIEYRAGYEKSFQHRTSLEQAMEQSKANYSFLNEIKYMPTLEILTALDKKMERLLIAIWIARIFQETISLHPATMGIRMGC